MSDGGIGVSSVSNFLSKMKTGVARPNRYLVRFFLPGGHGGNGVAVDMRSRVGAIQQFQSQMNPQQSIDVLCHTCSFPQRSLLTYEHKQFAAPYRVPYSQSYDPVTFSFYTDQNYTTREYFDIWQNAVVNIGSNTVNYSDEYCSDILVSALNTEGNMSYTILLLSAYPMNIGMVDLSYSNMNSAQNVTVTMAYRYWQSVTSATAINAGT